MAVGFAMDGLRLTKALMQGGRRATMCDIASMANLAQNVPNLQVNDKNVSKCMSSICL